MTTTSVAGEYLVGGGGRRISHSNAGGNADYIDITTQVFPTTNPMVFSVNLFYRFDPTISANDDTRNFLFETPPTWSIGLGQGAGDNMQWFFSPSTTLQPNPGPNTNDGNWHQATLVWDKVGSGTISFYHDGLLRD